LKSKLERLNDLSASDPEEKDEIVNVMGDIVGQLCGNPTLAQKCPKLIRRTAAYVDKPQTLTEPRKRGLVSELRETIRNADVQNYDKLIKGQP
jgi:hypothetical protein